MFLFLVKVSLISLNFYERSRRFDFFSSQTLAKKNSLLELELLKLMLLTYNEQIKLEREKYIRELGILSTPLNFIPSLVEKIYETGVDSWSRKRDDDENRSSCFCLGDSFRCAEITLAP